MKIIVVAALIAGVVLLLIINHADKSPSHSKDNDGCIGKLITVCVIIMLVGLFAIGAKNCSNSIDYDEPAHMFRP